MQNAISYIQTADGFIGQMTKVLSRMSELVILAKDVTKNSADVSLYAREFEALQDQLRQTIGGSSDEIGGPGVESPLGQFNGIEMFGVPTATGIGASDPLRVAIDGDGYFIVEDSPGEYFATREGEFRVDENGRLIGARGLKVVGVTGIGTLSTSPGVGGIQAAIQVATPPAGAALEAITIAANGELTEHYSNGTSAMTARVQIQDFNQAGLLSDIGGGVFSGVDIADPKTPYPTTMPVWSGPVEMRIDGWNIPGTNGLGSLQKVPPGMNVTIGQAEGQTMNIAQIDLRSGAMGEIIRQDSSETWALNLADSDAIASITNAIQHLAQQRASLGASQSRLEVASSSLGIESENLASSISRIRDADVAEESTQYAKYNILVQSGAAMLAQANQTPRSVLKLLQK